MQASVRRLLQRRRDRGIHAIMSVAEAQNLDPAAHDALRRVVMNQLNVFHDLVFDVLESMVPNGDGPILNEVWLEQIQAIHSVVVGAGED